MVHCDLACYKCTLITLLSDSSSVALSSGLVGIAVPARILIMRCPPEMPTDDSPSCLALSLYCADSVDLMSRIAVQQREQMQVGHRWHACSLALRALVPGL